MQYSRREFLLGLGAFGGLYLIGGVQRIVAAREGDFEMLVVGDSLVSGQGLKEEDKFSTLTKNWLESDFFHGSRSVDYKNLSHSGARLFLSEKQIQALTEAEKDPEQFYHPEVNFSFPSIKTQVDLAIRQYVAEGKSGGDVDLVLMTGSLTDISSSYILDAFRKYKPLRRKIEKYCNEDMFRFLKYATGVFPNALFVVVGYFPMLSKKSSSGEIYNAVLELYNFPGPAKPVLNNILTKQLFKIVHGRMTKRSKIWFEGSTRAQRNAVSRINEHNGKLSAVFVESPIPVDRSFETKDSLLWGMGKKGRSDDDMYDQRQVECPKAIDQVRAVELRFRQRFCELSGLGHPNPEGSRLYAEAITKALKETLAVK